MNEEEELFERWWKLRQKETWSAPPDEPRPSWGAAFKPDARKAWLARAAEIDRLRDEIQRLREGIRDWCDNRMADYSDQQYGKGQMKRLLESS